MLNNLLKKFTGHDQSDESAKGDSPGDSNLETWSRGDVILERYRINDVFSGAMGRVYIAEHLGWKVQMAIKAPKPEIFADKEGFKRVINEANSWVRMGMHPNVATCYYALNIEDVPYLFIEFVDGGDLSSWIKSGRCQDLRTVLSLAIQFCHGMEFTHSKGIIHRDIKPGNILITKNALLKITDFGIIQNIKDKSNNLALAEGTSDDTIGFRGTPGYASPEQFRDTHSVDGRSDIFSFGICLWLMLCGYRPYKNNAVQTTALKPVPKDPKTPFPPILTEILLKSVAFAPEDRYPNFTELRNSLNEAHIALFRVPCPYMDLDFSDIQAENLNNRAISLLELGKQAEGEKCLQKALDIDDTLTEAIFNYTLLKWHKGYPTERLIKQIKASQARQPDAVMLDTLTQAIKCDSLRDVWADDTDDMDEDYVPSTKKYFPEYLLCLPKNTLDVFQNSQLLNSSKANITDLFENKQYENCHELLAKVWQNNNFKKDNFLAATYEKLLKVSKKKELRAAIRLRTIRNSEVPARQLLCLPRTKNFFTLCQDGTIIVRDYGTTSKIKTLGKYKSICSFVISADGSHIGLGFTDGKVDILSLRSGKTECSFSTGTPITALSFNYDSKYIAAGGKNGLIKILPIADKSEEELEFSAPEGGAIVSLVHFNKGNDFVSGHEDGKIRHWYINEQDPIRIINAHAMPVTMISETDNGLLYISESADRSIKIWDRQTGQCMQTIMAHDETITSAMVMHDSNYFITASSDDIIKFWDISTGESTIIMDGRSNGITTLAHGPRPHIFCTGGQDGAIIFWMAIYDLEFN